MKNKQVWLRLGLLFLVLLGGFFLAQSRGLSFHFVDEEDHIIHGYYMNQGFELYKDLSTNHQPLVYLASNWLQKIYQANSIFLVIKRHRLAVFSYGAIWSIFLVWRFKWVGLIFVALFEWLKYFLFGNLLLMESLAVYPGVYLLTAAWEMVKDSKVINKIKKLESVFLGFSSFLVVFNLIPLWPWLAIIWLIFWLKNKKRFVWQMIGALVPTLILFILISPIDWFRETVRNNYLYAAPQLSVVKTTTDWLRLIFFPWLAFGVKDSLQAGFIKLFVAGWSGGLVYLLIKKDKRLIWWLGIYGLLFLANNRVLDPGTVFYQGFHLLPWLAMLMMVFGLSLKLLWREKKLRWPLAVIFGGWISVLLLNKAMPYFWRTKPIEEYHINYSPFDDFGFAVKTLARPGDRLAVLTNESLIHWQTGTVPATRQIVYYSWHHMVPDLEKDFEETFSLENDDPPEFIYGQEKAQLIEEKYVNLLKYGKETLLAVRKDIAEAVDPKQKQTISDRGFSLSLSLTF